MTSDHPGPQHGQTETADKTGGRDGDGQAPAGGVLDAKHRVLTIGLAASVTVVAFLWLGVTTVMPVIAKELHGLDLYGWAFTGFMLANMLAAATVGQWADHAGPRYPFLASLAVFVAGCVAAATAPGWIALLIGRSAQGFGVGGVLTIVYLTVGRNYPDHLRAKMLALVASCWTIPALAGPVLLGALADLWGWRAVFWLFVPLVILAAIPAVPGLRGPGAGGRIDQRQMLATLGLAIGVGALLVGLDSGRLVPLIVLAIVGIAIALPSLWRLMPPGFLTGRKGLPTAVLVRGLVSAGYYGSEAFFPLAMTTVFAFSTIGSGFALAVGAITWVVGAWGQAKFDVRGGDRGRRHRIIIGFILLTAGLAAIAVSLATTTALGAAMAIIGWAAGGLGMGLVYPSVTTLALSQTPDEHKGATSGSLQLSETLSVAVVTGLSGALVALGKAADWEPTVAIAIVFVLTGLAALAGIIAGPRTLDPRGQHE
ncbi:MFS transporter [Actinoallomurus sp. CA-150999]|uniref:MFS transporter n=1 Tax=Actinoallomurus sp. CA-150999 TaxID=3239887 RepID=UPI003D8AA588